jgi:hypothetical protein
MSKAISFEQFATELGVAPVTVQRWGRRRKFRVLKLGYRTYRVERDEADRFKRQRSSQSVT